MKQIPSANNVNYNNISSNNNVTAAAASKAGKVQRLEIKKFFSRIKTFPCHRRCRRHRRHRRRRRHLKKTRRQISIKIASNFVGKRRED